MLKILAKNTPIFIIFFILAWQIIPNFRFYSRPFNREFLEKLYSESQYVIGEVSKGGIGDDGLYAFAGDYYFRGGDITKVNFENPPLGKYLIGLSIRIFNNENMIYLFYLFIILIFVYKLIILISKNKKMAFLTVFLLLVDKTFRLQYLPQDATQLSITLLDLPLLMFVLLGIYFMLLKTRGGYLLSSLFLGLAVSTKFFPAIILFVTLFIYWVYVSHRQSLRIYLSSLILIPIVYLLSHLNFLF